MIYKGHLLKQCEFLFTFWIRKLDDNVIFKNIDFFYSRDSVHPNSFQSALKPFVICSWGLVNCLLLPSLYLRSKHD